MMEIKEDIDIEKEYSKAVEALVMSVISACDYTGGIVSARLMLKVREHVAHWAPKLKKVEMSDDEDKIKKLVREEFAKQLTSHTQTGMNNAIAIAKNMKEWL